MASLREIKDHIASVRSTLKITSAMKLVASAKLRKAQQAAEGIRPYTEALSEMLARVYPAAGAPDIPGDRVAIVAVASNSSLCGAFNINVIHKVQELIAECRAAGAEVEVLSVGRKMAEAMRKAGYPSPADYSDLVGHNSFEKSAAFAQGLIDAYNSGRYSSVLLVYNHFVNTASQKVQVESYLPFGSSGEGITPDPVRGSAAHPSQPAGWAPPSNSAEGGMPLGGNTLSGRREEDGDFILEPGREEILRTLLPQVMRLRIHTVLLDSIAAEHAARTLAMQTASDNAEDLLAELTLEYNKGRQQKITAEILDLVGGAQQ